MTKEWGRPQPSSHSYTMRTVVIVPTLISTAAAAAAGVTGQRNKVVFESVGDSCSFKLEVPLKFPLSPRVDLREFLQSPPGCLKLEPGWFAEVKDGRSKMTRVRPGIYEVSCAVDSVTDRYLFKDKNATMMVLGAAIPVKRKWSLNPLRWFSGRSVREQQSREKLEAMCTEVAKEKDRYLSGVRMELRRMDLTHNTVKNFAQMRRQFGIRPARKVDIDIQSDHVTAVSAGSCYVRIPHSIPVEESLTDHLTATLEEALGGACLEAAPRMNSATGTAELRVFRGSSRPTRPQDVTVVLTCTDLKNQVIGYYVFPIQSRVGFKELPTPSTDAATLGIYELKGGNLLTAKKLCGSVSAIRDLIVNVLSPPE